MGRLVFAEKGPHTQSHTHHTYTRRKNTKNRALHEGKYKIPQPVAVDFYYTVQVTYYSEMASRKKVVLKIIILGDSG
jgi:hypothetical protein